MTKTEFVAFLRAVINRQMDQIPDFETVDEGDDSGLVIEAGGTRFELDIRVAGPSRESVLRPDAEVDAERITQAINASIVEARISGTVSPDMVRQSLDRLYARKRADREAGQKAVND